jgi:hypothetical protein
MPEDLTHRVAPIVLSAGTASVAGEVEAVDDDLAVPVPCHFAGHCRLQARSVCAGELAAEPELCDSFRVVVEAHLHEDGVELSAVGARVAWQRTALEVSMTVHVVVADDHPMYRYGLAAVLTQHDGIDVVASVEDGDALIRAVHDHHGRRRHPHGQAVGHGPTVTKVRDRGRSACQGVEMRGVFVVIGGRICSSRRSIATASAVGGPLPLTAAAAALERLAGEMCDDHLNP